LDQGGIFLLYTPQEIAEILKVTEDIVIELLEQKRMEGVKVGDLWRITSEQFELFIKRNSTRKAKSIRYSKLEKYLRDVDKGLTKIEISFEEVKKIIECALPESAYKYRAWWASDPTHSQGLAWINAGWNVEFVDMEKQVVRFIRGCAND
jgi:excisionase family DNA binding protein